MATDSQPQTSGEQPLSAADVPLSDPVHKNVATDSTQVDVAQLGNSNPVSDAQTEPGLPGYQEACVIAADNLRELDMKAFLFRLRDRFGNSGGAQCAFALMLFAVEVTEMIIFGATGCYGAGLWTSALLFCTGVASISVSINGFRFSVVSRIVHCDVFGMICVFVSFVMFMNHSMSGGPHTSLEAQLFHITKMGLAVLIFIAVASKLYLYSQYDYNPFELSTGTASNVAQNTAPPSDADLRRASLAAIFEALGQNNSIRKDDPGRYDEPPPTYENIVGTPQPNLPPNEPSEQIQPPSITR